MGHAAARPVTQPSERDAATRDGGAGPHFSPDTLRFIRDLKRNNTREWFVANKARYEDAVKDPALRLIADFAPLLGKISPHFRATPRSLFRIHRDTRFSKDKSPYKTHVGIHFRHDRARDAHAPGYYLHIEPGSVFAGVGIWHPEGDALRKIRERIAEDPAGWKRASRTKAFTRTFELAGDALKRAPKGFDPAHPLVEDLKRKDFIGVVELDDTFVTKDGLSERLATTFAAGTPLMRFLCEALEVPF
jgi:uncharacterized protein (TIGR02453 family)